MTAVVIAVEVIGGATGLPITLLDKNAGGSVLIVLSLVSLLGVLASERRPLAEFGLVTPADWRRQALIGALLGAATYTAYCSLATRLGVFELDMGNFTPGRLAKAAVAALAAPPIAVVQQIIFTGLVIGMLRRATSAWGAVLLPAMVFAVFAALAKPGGLATGDGQRLLLGMVLLATLLGMLRLRTGTIVFPAGVLAGAIAVRRVAAKLRLLEANPLGEWTPWVAPAADPRQGPLMWLVLVLAITGVGCGLYRHGERQLPDDAAVSASFKRFMPFSNLLAFAPIDRWLVELARARFRVGVAYLPRLAFTLIASTLTTLAALPERLLAPRLLRHSVPDPVFIVGMHRSGTTYLHELLALDPQFRSPRNYEVFNPHGFLFGWLTTAAMTPLLMWRRPMDAVQMSVFSSQEEEFALAAMGGESPYWMFCFPNRVAEVERYWHPDEFQPHEFDRWQQNYRTFLRKLTWRTRRRPLLKNPVNTSRVAVLREMFPQAKFVYIVRHPHAVYRSNRHFAEHGFAVFQLEDAPTVDNYACRFLANYRRASEACERDLAAIPAGSAAITRFEDLEADPIGEVERIYAQLGLPVSSVLRARLVERIEAAAGYRKNRLAELSEWEREQVNAMMGEFLLKWGYASVPLRAAA